MKDFRELEVWRKSHELTLAIYKETESFPRTELFGLTSQMRRCCASIPANIAEGCGRSNDGDFHRFLQNAMGSGSELEYHTILAGDLGYLDHQTAVALQMQLASVKQMLVKLSRKVATDRYRN